MNKTPRATPMHEYRFTLAYYVEGRRKVNEKEKEQALRASLVREHGRMREDNMLM
ncbi:hypothetical protein WH47_09726 [Habropoda laboriosa]|uniref:Uncharacterized protein n=1 Tax=Habropoda laboriosa TaxID=597456 RepID=A0A0L7QMB4_9HYME|nr:hypothetical protein WH47_09726 [Habropoda laboriosa]